MDNTRELIAFTRHLHYLTKMGASLPESLGKLKESISNKKLKSSVKNVQSRLEEGYGLSEAMEEKEDVFSPDYVAIIEVAEKTDTLPEVLGELSSYLETLEIFRKNLKAATLYPLLVINSIVIFTFVIYYFASNVIFGQYVNFINELSVPIPFVTKVFIFMGKIFFSPLFITLILTGVSFLDMIFLSRSDFGNNFWSSIPFLKVIFQKAFMARIARSLGFMIKEGVTPDSALDLIGKTIESSKFRYSLNNASHELKKGRALSDAFKTSGLFDPIFILMIKQGEKTETLPSALLNVAEYIEDDMNMLYSTVFKFSEPVFIITAGIIVGFAVISVFLPFYTITGAIR